MPEKEVIVTGVFCQVGKHAVTMEAQDGHQKVEMPEGWRLVRASKDKKFDIWRRDDSSGAQIPVCADCFPCLQGEHDYSKSAIKCARCGADLCDLCMADDHFVSEGHDLSDPRYWGV